MTRAEAGLVAAQAVDQGRLWERHVALARIGGTPRGGVNRQALTAEEIRARQLLVEWGRALGLTAFVDPIGNLFLRRDGRLPDAAPVLTGSHLDTQPTGGRFDGAYGVLAGLEALQALLDAGVETRRPIEVVAWTNEEGCRFQPGCGGSGVFVGERSLERLLDLRDRAGLRFGDALAEAIAATPTATPRPLGFPVHAYLEAHIEQGPRLEQAGLRIGVVTGIQGSRRFEVDIEGEEAHAGTTPHAARKDALVAAVQIVQALRQLMHDPEDVVRFTVGRFETYPGSPNVVPGRVHFTIDFRHPEAEELRRRGDAVAGIVQAHAGPCQARVTDISYTRPIRFPADMVGLLAAAADALGLPAMQMTSGAGHDAGLLHRVCPAGMLFVPCERGVSHNEAENADPADLAAGARVLTKALVDLAS